MGFCRIGKEKMDKREKLHSQYRMGTDQCCTYRTRVLFIFHPMNCPSLCFSERKLNTWTNRQANKTKNRIDVPSACVQIDISADRPSHVRTVQSTYLDKPQKKRLGINYSACVYGCDWIQWDVDGGGWVVVESMHKTGEGEGWLELLRWFFKSGKLEP